ncbi:Retrovirus-related Pol polyprotein from transposon 17.6 [Vitis vinifera]|uniref:RNA-directed DNA polymerase n=1 Tax=Vitis vinifera TaxID=29760 RepID=A0A438KKB4_VITVI|nr:Retrovirus-related Pol polyprotein from transposon 17.6 [Vitis vinifera]
MADSSPSDVKGKKPFIGPRPTEVGAISSSSQRPFRRHQPIPQFSEPHSSYASHQYRPRTPRPVYDQTHMPQTLVVPSYATQGIERPAVSYTATGQPCYAAQFTARPAAPYPRPGAQQTSAPFALRTQRQFSQIGMPLSQALRKLTEAGAGHETDRCTALRHAIQDLIDQGLVHLGQPSVTTNPLPTHTTHAVPPPAGGIHFLDFDETDDHVHMLSWDDPDPEPIMPAGIYETSGVTLEPQMPAPFRLFHEAASVQTTTSEPLTFTRYSVQAPYILIPDVEEVRAPHVDISQTPDIQYILRGGRVMRQPPPAAARPVEGTSASQEEVRAEDDEILRQLQSTPGSYFYLEPFSVFQYSSGCTDSSSEPDQRLRPHSPLYISVSCSGRRVPSVLLDNGSALNVCPLATAIALGYAPSDFGPSTQTVRAYEVLGGSMGTLEIELLIGSATFVAIFQVLRIPTSFNLLLGRPWIHRAGAIPSSLHQKVKFIHDGQVVMVQSVGDMFIAAEPVLEITWEHSGARYYAEHVLSTRHGVGPTSAWTERVHSHPDHDVPFGLGFIPTEADYLYMARLRKERVRARLTHTPFDYPLRPYTMSLSDYFVRASEPLTRADVIIGGLSTTQEVELQRLVPAPYDACFPDETDEHGTFDEVGDIVDGAAPHDEYIDEMLALSMSQIEETVHPGLASSFDLFGPCWHVEGASDSVDPPLSFDVLSGFVSRSDIVSDIFDIDDEIAQHDSDDDSSSVSDSDPVDQRVSPAVGDTEIVDFGTTDQPRELRIGSDLSTDERDSLIQLLRAYLDVFAWSYEDMPGLDPSIVQHRLPLLPQTRPVKQKLRRLHPRWSLQVKKEIQKQLSVGFYQWLSTRSGWPMSSLFPRRTQGHSMLSFMDGFSGYSQILMAPEDMEKTSFITEWGTYCYRIRSLSSLGEFFERIRQFRLRLNPKKCTFGVTSGKLLGYMVSERGIEVDPDKIRAILDMPAPRTEREVRGFLGRLQYISRFIARLTDILLAPPTPGRPLLLYLSVSDVALGCMLAQLDDSGKDRAIYYLSKRMLDYETRYVMIERYCLALVWATRRLRHYMTEYSVHLISRLDPLRYLFDRPALVGRLMRWLVLLTEFDIHYVTQKSIRGSIVADHLASLPVSDARAIDDDFQTRMSLL